MMKSDKETAGIMSKHEAESPSDKGALAEAVREQEKNMACDYSVPKQNRAMIRKYKG